MLQSIDPFMINMVKQDKVFLQRNSIDVNIRVVKEIKKRAVRLL